MSLIKKIQAGDVTLEALRLQLAEYEVQRIELRRNQDKLGAELFQARMSNLDLSISFTQIFIEKFDDIKTA